MQGLLPPNSYAQFLKDYPFHLPRKSRLVTTIVKTKNFHLVVDVCRGGEAHMKRGNGHHSLRYSYPLAVLSFGLATRPGHEGQMRRLSRLYGF